MEKRHNSAGADDMKSLSENIAILRSVWWKIVLFSFAVGVVTLLWMFRLQNVYRSSAIITPSVEDNKPNPTLSALASFGVTVGGPSNVVDLESLFKSNDLTVRVFSKYMLWEIVYPDSYNVETGKLRSPWMDRIMGYGKGPRLPDDWDAIRSVKKRLNVLVNKRADTILLSFDSPSPEGSAKIVRYYLEEGKSRLQEEAFERANRNKKFIEEQIAKTVDALTKERLYSLYGQEVEREMLARNREQFGFRLVDSPRVPDRKLKPHRTIGTITTTLLSFFLACGYFLARKQE